MRTREFLVLSSLVVASCTQFATYTGFVTVEGVEDLNPERLHWGATSNKDQLAQLGQVQHATARERTKLNAGRLEYQLAESRGPIDIAFWYDVNGNETLDAGDKTGRIGSRVQGRYPSTCGDEKTVVPPMHLGDTFVAEGDDATPTGSLPDEKGTEPAAETKDRKLQPCAIELRITGQEEPHGGAEVDERGIEISAMGVDYRDDMRARAPVPLSKTTVLELDVDTRKNDDGTISYEGDDGGLKYTFRADGRPLQIEVDPVADSRYFEYTYVWDCSDRPAVPRPVYRDQP